MVEPTGVPAKSEIKSPKVEQMTEMTAEEMVTARKLLKIRMELNAGKTIKLLIIMAPINLIPITIVSDVKTAISEL